MAHHLQPNCDFVADGRERLKAAAYDAVRLEVEREFAERLPSAGWFGRVLLKCEIRREIHRRLDQIAPLDALYFALKR
ncbi:MAG: hypothetical protein U0805_00940 [Pirellulales bacterium]